MLKSGEQIQADKEEDMDFQNILQQLRHEVGRLDAAISALEGTTPRRGRPRKTSEPTQASKAKRRHMSAAARAKIAAAQRARWAKQKGTAKQGAAKKAPAKKVVGRKGMSAASRKRLSELMKQRWAARKKTA